MNLIISSISLNQKKQIKKYISNINIRKRYLIMLTVLLFIYIYQPKRFYNMKFRIQIEMRRMFSNLKLLFIHILWYLAIQDSSCQTTRSYPLLENINNLIDITESSVYIVAYRNGTLQAYTYEFVLLQTRLVCQGDLNGIDKLPYSSNYIVICDQSIQFHSYQIAIVIENVYNFTTKIKGYLVWPYFQLHIANRDCDEKHIKLILCEIILQHHGLNCSQTVQIQRPNQVIVQSNQYTSIKMTLMDNYTDVIVYSESRCSIIYRLPMVVEDFTVTQLGESLVFQYKDNLYKCSTLYCYNDYAIFQYVGQVLPAKKFLIFKDQDIYAIADTRNIKAFNINSNTWRFIYVGEPSMSLIDVSEGFIIYISNIRLTKYVISGAAGGTSTTNYQRIYPIICDLISHTINISNVNQQGNCNSSDIPVIDTQIATQPSLNQTQIDCETQSCSIEIVNQIPGDFVNFLSSIMSFPYSGMTMKLILPQVLDQMWYYEYHAYEYTNQTLSILNFIGNVNRNKFLPFFIKSLMGSAYNTYDGFRKGFTESKREFSSEKFVKNQEQPTMFMANTAKLYVQNSMLSITLFFSLRIIAIATRKWHFFHKKFIRFEINQAIFIFLLESHAQFVTFMFLQQVKIMFSDNIYDKANIIFMCLLTFAFLIFALSSYPLLLYFVSERKFKLLYPQVKKLTYKTYLMLVLIGGGRKILLGAIQSFYNHLPIQVVLLTISHLISVIIYSKILNLQKKSGIVLPELHLRIKYYTYLFLIFFTLSVLNDHLNIIASKFVMNQIQMVCICLISSLCIIQISQNIISFLCNLGKSFKISCQADESIQESVNQQGSSEKQIQRIVVNQLEDQQNEEMVNSQILSLQPKKKVKFMLGNNKSLSSCLRISGDEQKTYKSLQIRKK